MTEPGHAVGQFGSSYERDQTCSRLVNKVVIIYKVFHIVLSFSRRQVEIYLFKL